MSLRTYMRLTNRNNKGVWESCRLPDLKEGDIFRQEDDGYENFDENRAYICKGNPYKNDKGVWTIVVDDVEGV
jgi:hypothetical protein